MRLRGFRSWGSFALSALLYVGAHAAEDSPKVTSTKFEHSTYDLRYFDDSDVILLQDYTEDAIYRSPDAGATWHKIKAIPEKAAWSIITHPFDNKRAYVLTEGSTHYRTEDRGETWTEWWADDEPSMYMDEPLSFNAADPDKIILNSQDCILGYYCEETSMYTLDGFRTDAKFLRAETAGCSWAKGTSIFAERQPEIPDDRILCIAQGKYTSLRKDFRLLISDNFFDSSEREPELEAGRTVTGIARQVAVKGYVVAASVADMTDEMALYVTDDTEIWHRAVFPHDHKLREEAYTILESTNYSIQIDVMTTKATNPMGVLLSSNSNGTYFTRNIEHTNRNTNGFVDFEKVSGIQGIVLVNVVDNWKDVEASSSSEKKVKTQISFDDGRTWHVLKAGDEDLHIHSVTDTSNSGRVFSSLAPGLLMAVGNTGSHLKSYKDGDFYVSEDAGVTWHKRLDGPHKYEFGDSGGILVAVKDASEVEKMSYSFDFGRTWNELPLPEKIHPTILTTSYDSTSLKFLLLGKHKKGEKTEHYIMNIDFEGVSKKACTGDDMERWYARVDDKGDPTCLMGHKQYYNRRKPEANCFMKQKWVEPEPKFEKCDCTDIDYECDFNFVRDEDRTKCVPAGPLVVPAGACKKSDETFKGSSGWRKIPGDDCKDPSSGAKDALVERPCSESVAPPASGQVTHETQTLKGKDVYNYLYFERTESSTGDDETVIAHTDAGVFLSHDHGKSWKQILKDVNIKYIIRHRFLNDRVFFVADHKKVYYSLNRGDNIQEFDTKVPYQAHSRPFPMSFHPTKPDWIIWTGKQCSKEGGDCHAVSSISKDRGDSWKTMKRYVERCEFVVPPQRSLKAPKHDELIYCEVRTKESSDLENNPVKLISSEDFFDTEETHFDNIADFATMSEFLVVAKKLSDGPGGDLGVSVSVDGSIFADAVLPQNFKVEHQKGYTVLDSSTHAVFLHVTVDDTPGQQWGGILKSNSNGTSYVLSLNNVNRDLQGYVDFEKMTGLEGVALANIVSNLDTVQKDGRKKKRTMITHNDGGEWRLLPAPEKDAEGKSFSCKAKDIEKCSLNIHGYTERFDKSKTYSSSSAVGLMLAVGNVGDSLADIEHSDTYITRDAGITWHQIKKGSHMWEFGDQGSVIVLVSDREETNIVSYSRDEGETWTEYKFSDKKLPISDITTLPSDNSRKFLLWTKDGNEIKTIALDFTGLTDRQCVLDENNDSSEDYYLWSPHHPTQDDDCLFGHISQYHRKQPKADCYNGRMLDHLHNVEKNCTCTRQDFECDYNYQMFRTGECLLVPGLNPLDHSQQCLDNPDLEEYYEPTGYRRIPLTTCQGGLEMDKLVAHPCPGKEDEFERKRGLSGVWIFIIVLLSIIMAGGVGWGVWHTWKTQFGQIRLGEQPSIDGEAPYIKYPVMAIAAVGAVIIAAPSVASSVWDAILRLFGRSRAARFTTRSSFARNPRYEAIDEDEGELLGEDSDEEV